VLIETPPPAYRGNSFQTKPDNALATTAMGAVVMRDTTRHGEWVDIPAGRVKLHTWISYPDGTAKAPVVIVLSDVAGMWDDFPRAVADQLARDGFIGVAPDFVSGKGPKGGNWDSFESVNLAVDAAKKLTIDDALTLTKGAWEYALKLPRSNGNGATLGFAFGGDASFVAAARLPGVRAAITYDGTRAPDAVTMAKIAAPVLAFGGDLCDPTVEMVASAAPAMEKLGKSFEYHIYARTTGQFVPVGFYENNNHANVAAWARSLAFLRDHTM
jgi:carboxymethylenebutenolidase